MTNRDWTIRVYAADSGIQIDEWDLINRTEHEADREAAADVRREYGSDVDWSLIIKVWS
jgi:hypothetical protein